MNILSIDIGSVNLAYCHLEVNDNNYYIKQWNIISLSNPPCYCVNKECNNKASFRIDDLFYCKLHAKKSIYSIEKETITAIKKKKLIDLKQWMLNHELEFMKKKADNFPIINEYYKTMVLQPFKQEKKTSMIDISKNIKKQFDKFNVVFDAILIENQIGKVAIKMKCIQSMITQYYIDKNITNIIYVSPYNKLKSQSPNKNRISYKQRKKMAIDLTNETIHETITNSGDWIPFFNKHKKKDDLADSYLQVVWYINNASDLK